MAVVLVGALVLAIRSRLVRVIGSALVLAAGCVVVLLLLQLLR